MNIETALIDLSGTLHIGNKAIPGAVDAVSRLRNAGIAIGFVSNTSRCTRAELASRLQTLGFDIKKDGILTAPQAAKFLIKTRGLRPHLLIHENLLPEFHDIDTRSPDCVLVADAGDGFTYATMNEAFRLLMKGAPLIATGMNRYFRDDDELSLDAGPFVRALEYAADTEAILTGKPAPGFFQAALDLLDAKAGTSIMIGDDAESDVAGAMRLGLSGILVQTGKYHKGDERKAAGCRCYENIGAAVHALIQKN